MSPQEVCVVLRRKQNLPLDHALPPAEFQAFVPSFMLGTLCWLQGGSVAGRAVEALSSGRLCLKVETDKKSSHQTQVITKLIKSPEEKQDVDEEQRRLM